MCNETICRKERFKTYINRSELLEKTKNCVPNLGWEYEYPDLFGKYGRTIPGICEYWMWYDNLLEQATDEELLEMITIANDYWLSKYKEWYKNANRKSSKLDSFIGECEGRFFGYDEDGYTDKTIDRILDSSLKIISEKFSNDKTNRGNLKPCNVKRCGGNVDLSFGNCPTCNVVVNSVMNFCYHCGQNLDWSE